MQPQEVRQGLGVLVMGKRVVGPSPPEPNWDRLDLRGINSTRNAWGYLAPDDSAIVSDDGKVFIRVDKSMVEKPKSGKEVLIRLVSSQWMVLKRCLRWSKIIKDLYDFEHEVEDDGVSVGDDEDDSVEVVLPPPKKKPNLHLVPSERKRKLSMRRFK
jgi:hypothetical protein